MRNHNLKKVLCTALAAAIAASMGACSSPSSQGSGSSSTSAATSGAGSTASTTAASQAAGSGDRPALTYWTPYVGYEQITLNDSPMYKELQERVGVNLEFSHPPQGQVKEQFNIMLASGDLPDIIEYTWLSYPGGPEKALAEGHIVELDFENNAPNLWKLLNDNPELLKAVKTDTGKFYEFPMIRLDEETKVAWGMTLRKDMLDEVGLEAPETIQEWHDLLTAVKEKYPGIIPYTVSDTSLTNNFGLISAYTHPSFFHVDNKVRYFATEPEYKEFLIEMNKWYQEGLLDPDIGAVEDDASKAKVMNDKAFSITTYGGSGIGQMLQGAPNETFDLMAVKYPVLNKGDKPEYGNYSTSFSNGYAGAITSTCKNVEAAYKVLDYGYSEEGHLLFNFGIEGESYTMVDGVPTYTEKITNNPDGLTMAQALGQTVRATQSASMVQDKHYSLQYLGKPQQQNALKVWADTNEKNHIMPMVTPTPEESSELAGITNEITTYVDEMSYKFILGTEDINAKYDEFLETLNKMGVARAIEIKQAALDRYNSR